MPLSADEFIAGVPGFADLAPAVQCDLLALYLLSEAGASYVTPASLSSLRSALHLSTYSRISAYLSEQSRSGRGGHKGRYVKLKEGYALERAYSSTLKKEYLGRPTTKHLSAGLRSTLTAISDPPVRAYLEEAISCFEFGLHRSALIMAWCVAYGLFRGWLFRGHLAQFNSITSQWKSPTTINTLEDFQELTEASVLDTSRKAQVISKEQFKVLKQLLDQRNSFAHPTTRVMTPAIAEAYIDTVLRDIIPTFG
jgi:hypothetical protein